MNEQARMFLRLELLLNVLALIMAAVICYHVHQTLSFTGFGGLFVLLLLTPYAAGTAGAVLLLLVSFKTRRRRYALIAFILQIAAPLPWLGALLSITASWTEAVMVIQIVAGILGLMLLSAKKDL